ncbi:MAG: hypothetical protein E7262_01185 [Lachnospiraceae bacterium]|nr:hypothetical protein [Lachnospiraceae bacterium]
MINNEKVRLMAKLAIYEKNNEEDIKLSKYYKVDYVKHNILKTIISVTIAYACILGLIVFYNMEYFLAEAFNLDYTIIGVQIVVTYLMTVIVFSLLSFLIYGDKIKNSRERLVKYNSNLKKLSNMYDDEKNGM